LEFDHLRGRVERRFLVFPEDAVRAVLEFPVFGELGLIALAAGGPARIAPKPS